jgi:hypothetical protein
MQLVEPKKLANKQMARQPDTSLSRLPQGFLETDRETAHPAVVARPHSGRVSMFFTMVIIQAMQSKFYVFYEPQALF